jgi:hypothetical protein
MAESDSTVSQKQCRAPGCCNDVLAKGLCVTHYTRMLRHGSFDLPPKKYSRPLTQESLRELLHYDPETGIFTRKTGLRTGFGIGAVAGGQDGKGYTRIMVLGKKHHAHRLAWLYVYGKLPELSIDHINGIRTDNRIANLRDVSHSVNMQNRRVGNNGRGALGVRYRTDIHKWQADIVAFGKRSYLGCYDTEDAAYQAYLAAKRRLHEGCTI